jgi:hypothetical protein
MQGNKITRRSVLQSASAGAVLGLWGVKEKTTMAAETPPRLKIHEPFHGAVFHDHVCVPLVGRLGGAERRSGSPVRFPVVGRYSGMATR